MKIISPANATVMQMLKNFKKPGTKYRKLKYLVDTEVEDGILLFNLFTRELLILSREEYDNAIDNEYLKNQWFIVPEECDEKAYVDLVKTLLKSRKPKFEEITGYTIFTTTDCNARCFYCFEAGRSRIPMSIETAHKVSKYIKNHCNGKKVSIRWFGGEPLMNVDAINIISESLRNEGIDFTSSMVTNGYLITDHIVDSAVNLWNLKRVQISLDGTETVYNKVKAYVNSTGNAFEIVISNMKRLLDANINLTIRLNMDLYNADDLLTLVKFLCNRFDGYQNLSIYAHHLFDSTQPDAELHSEAEWNKRAIAMAKITEEINKHGFAQRITISTKPKISHCMADSGHSITILPDGFIGLCEHYSDSDYIGHIDSEGFDQTMVQSFSQTVPEITECANCFFYPDCIMLSRCNSSSKCYPQYVSDTRKKMEQIMIRTYTQKK